MTQNRDQERPQHSEQPEASSREPMEEGASEEQQQARQAMPGTGEGAAHAREQEGSDDPRQSQQESGAGDAQRRAQVGEEGVDAGQSGQQRAGQQQGGQQRGGQQQGAQGSMRDRAERDPQRGDVPAEEPRGAEAEMLEQPESQQEMRDEGVPYDPSAERRSQQQAEDR